MLSSGVDRFSSILDASTQNHYFILQLASNPKNNMKWYDV